MKNTLLNILALIFVLGLFGMALATDNDGDGTQDTGFTDVYVSSNLGVVGKVTAGSLEYTNATTSGTAVFGNTTTAKIRNGNYISTNGIVEVKTVTLVSTQTFEGATANDYETIFSAVDPTADRTITIPDDNGTLVLTSANQTITGNKTFGVSTTAALNNGNYVTTNGRVAIKTFIATGTSTFGNTTSFTITNGVYSKVYMKDVNNAVKRLKITALGNVSGVSP